MRRPGDATGMRPTLVLALCTMLVAACGTRLPDEAFAPEERIVSTGDADDGDAGGDVASGDGAVTTTTVDGASGDGSTSGSGGEGGQASGGGGGEQASGGGGGGAASGPNQASDVGVTETTIRIGNITAENGVLGDTFAPAVRGLRAWVQHTNANGGINGRQVELFTCDDREDRARTLECARRLVEQDQVFALVATNSRALGGASQYLADKDVPVLGFPINNAFYRFPEFFTIYGTAYERNGDEVGIDGNIVSLSGQYRWFKDNMGLTKAAVFRYDIAESAQAGQTFINGLEAEGFSVQAYTVSFAAPSFDQAVADMQRRGVELIFDSMDDGANRRLCDAMTRRGFTPKAKVSTVVIMGDGVESNYDKTCRNVIFVPTESQPYTSGVDEVAEFSQAYARYQPGLPRHQWALEAWAMGNITRDALESMGPAPTRKGFIEFLDTMDPNTADGIMVGTYFRPEQIDYRADTNRDCFAIVRWLDSEGGWTNADSKFPFCYPDAKTFSAPAAEQGT